MKHAYFVLRWMFIVLLSATAIGKLLDNRGFAAVIETYDLVRGDFILYLGLGVSLFELFLAFAIFIRFRLKTCGVLVTLMHIGYLALAVLTLQRGIQIKNCGCFGVFLSRPLTLTTVAEDSILVVLSLLFLKLTPHAKGSSP